MPDAELLRAAGLGTLRDAGRASRSRSAACWPTSASEALATRFASQWLRLQDLDKIFPDYLLYPQYDDTLAQAMKQETELFFDSLVREDRSLLDLLTADYSFVNERLARHYGIPNVTGNAFQRVTLPPYRRGLLGQGSILTLTSVADRTSPVQRGKWVMEVLLASPPPPPPPNVPALDDSVKANEGGKMLSTRERMEEHRKNPTCNSCHRVIDPLGLALENFDVTGAWRIKDNEVPVDSVGDLYDGTQMDGPAGLRAALLKHKDMFLTGFTESLMTYALGRRVEYTDMPAVRAIVRDAAKKDYKMSAFVLGVVNSPAFQMGVADTGKSERRATDVARNGQRFRVEFGQRSRHVSDAEAPVPPHRPEGHRRHDGAAVPRGDGPGARRRPRPRAARSASPPSRWCTAPPAAPRSASRRTCGRRPRSAATSTCRRAACSRSSRSATTSPSSATPTCATPRRSPPRKSAAITSARARCS